MMDDNVSLGVVQSEIASVKELMSANFRTLQVQLEALTSAQNNVTKDVEALKVDVASIRHELVARRVEHESLARSVADFTDEFMTRDELGRTFVRRAELADQRHWMRGGITLLLTGIGVVAAITLGILNAV
jgi:capsule polysaccharide export protein KpsE/RkpR